MPIRGLICRHSKVMAGQPFITEVMRLASVSIVLNVVPFVVLVWLLRSRAASVRRISTVIGGSLLVLASLGVLVEWGGTNAVSYAIVIVPLSAMCLGVITEGIGIAIRGDAIGWYVVAAVVAYVSLLLFALPTVQ